MYAGCVSISAWSFTIWLPNETDTETDSHQTDALHLTLNAASIINDKVGLKNVSPGPQCY